MRVLFLTHRLPYAVNRGDRIRAFYLLRLLSRHADVDLLSLVHSAEEESHAPDLAGIASSVTTARTGRLRGLVRAGTALMTQGTFTHALLDAASARPALQRIVNDRRPDVVLAYCSGMARFALEPPLAGIPLVIDMLDVDSQKWRALGESTAGPRGWIYALEARRLAAFEIEAANRAHSVLVVNERERASLLQLAPSATVHIVANGIDLEMFHPAVGPTAEHRVSFCGVMDYPPNEEAALWFAREVWPSVRARHPDATFSIVGSAPTRAIRRLSERDPSIEVSGAVPDVRPYLWRSAVSVAPLFVSRGVQNKVIEALAAGLPCVVTPAVRQGLPAEALAGVREASDADAFARAVLDLLDMDPRQRQEVASRAALETFTWSERLSPLLTSLERAAGKQSTSSIDSTGIIEGAPTLGSEEVEYDRTILP